MKPLGHLSQYFIGVGAKTLMGTEIDPKVSRGHEFQGVDSFRAFLGTPTEKIELPVTYVWMDDENEPVKLDSKGTWYDSRRGKAKRTPEYRLYYPAAAEDIVYRAKTGDTLFLCLPKEGHLHAILCLAGSTVESQLLWLFGLSLEGSEITQRDFREEQGAPLAFTERMVLDLLGVEVAVEDDNWLEKIIQKFGEKFPSTSAFSEFARKTAPKVSALEAPDDALMVWMEHEERLFRTLEKHIVGQRLSQGFLIKGEPDVDGFISYSLGVQNRRKARVGAALENHIATIFDLNKIKYVKGAKTEQKKKPDFLFPSLESYKDMTYPDSKLAMLGAKSTCKDRWRQVLTEAARIKTKHLLTLEPSISVAQTDEMQDSLLQLVVPKPIHPTFNNAQAAWLLSLADFMAFARKLDN